MTERSETTPNPDAVASACSPTDGDKTTRNAGGWYKVTVEGAIGAITMIAPEIDCPAAAEARPRSPITGLDAAIAELLSHYRHHEKIWQRAEVDSFDEVLAEKWMNELTEAMNTIEKVKKANQDIQHRSVKDTDSADG